MKRRKNEESLIRVVLTLRERDLITGETFADPEYTDRLTSTGKKDNTITAKYTAEEIDDLIGYIAAEANHTKSKKLEKELDKLFDKLKKLIEP